MLTILRVKVINDCLWIQIDIGTDQCSLANQKRKRIKAGSGERMRKVGSKGSPTAANFKKAAKTAKKTKSKKR